MSLMNDSLEYVLLSPRSTREKKLKSGSIGQFGNIKKPRKKNKSRSVSPKRPSEDREVQRLPRSKSPKARKINLIKTISLPMFNVDDDSEVEDASLPHSGPSPNTDSDDDYNTAKAERKCSSGALKPRTDYLKPKVMTPPRSISPSFADVDQSNTLQPEHCLKKEASKEITYFTIPDNLPSLPPESKRRDYPDYEACINTPGLYPSSRVGNSDESTPRFGNSDVEMGPSDSFKRQDIMPREILSSNRSPAYPERPLMYRVTKQQRNRGHQNTSFPIDDESVDGRLSSRKQINSAKFDELKFWLIVFLLTLLGVIFGVVATIATKRSND